MIIIDGQQSHLQVDNFENLEELLVEAMNGEAMTDRVVTDVLVNDEPFSEIYPHQAEDLEANEIDKVEIVSVSNLDMAVNIARELYKVVNLMEKGGTKVGDLFRQADDGEALEMYQDLLDVTRDFLGMVSLLRDNYSLDIGSDAEQSMDDFSELLNEIIEVQENEDWILLSDLLEYEFIPLVQKWKKLVAGLRDSIRQSVRN